MRKLAEVEAASTRLRPERCVRMHNMLLAYHYGASSSPASSGIVRSKLVGLAIVESVSISIRSASLQPPAVRHSSRSPHEAKRAGRRYVMDVEGMIASRRMRSCSGHLETS